MLLITRHLVSDQAEFLETATEMLSLLSSRPGYVAGRVAQAIDEPGLMMISMEWSDVGSYRRAYSDFAVRMAAVPLLSSALDEPSAFQVAVDVTDGTAQRRDTDMPPAADPDRATRRGRT